MSILWLKISNYNYLFLNPKLKKSLIISDLKSNFYKLKFTLAIFRGFIATDWETTYFITHVGGDTSSMYVILPDGLIGTSSALICFLVFVFSRFYP
jgi:hypothetical protein